MTPKSLHWPLLAESGSQNLVFPAFLTSALPPEAANGLISLPGAAADPKRPSAMAFAVPRRSVDREEPEKHERNGEKAKPG